MKREMPILFPVTCEMTIIFSVKSSLYNRRNHLSSLVLATVNPGVLTGVEICSGFR